MGTVPVTESLGWRSMVRHQDLRSRRDNLDGIPNRAPVKIKPVTIHVGMREDVDHKDTLGNLGLVGISFYTALCRIVHYQIPSQTSMKRVDLIERQPYTFDISSSRLETHSASRLQLLNICV